MGEVLGPQSAFIGEEQLRELLLAPTSTLRRLVTHPDTGQLVVRDSATYRPDERLKAFVRARDLLCKGPGCTRPAMYADLDHVIPWPQGTTSAANLNLDCRREHLVKTYELWRCVMAATGWATWTTFFQRVYTTRPHDYRQYSPTLGRRATPTPVHPPASAAGPAPITETPGAEPPSVRDLLLDGGALSGLRRSEAGALASRLIYAALAFRPGRGRLRGSDDGPWDDTVPDHAHDWLSTVPLRLRHRSTGGQLRHGPPPDQPTAEEILTDEGLAERRRPPQADAQHDQGLAERRRPPQVDAQHDQGLAERRRPRQADAQHDHDPWQDIPPF